MDKREKITLMFDYLQGPIWISDIETGEPLTGIEIIDNDDEIAKLNFNCAKLYSECYEFDIENQPCLFNKEKARNNKNKILDLLLKIKCRLNEINDGTFFVEDLATKEIENL